MGLKGVLIKDTFYFGFTLFHTAPGSNIVLTNLFNIILCLAWSFSDD